MQKNLYVFLIVCLVLFAFGCGRKSDNAEGIDFLLESKSIERELTTLYLRKADSSVIDTVRHTLAVTYPFISNWDNQEAEHIFNTWVKNLTDENVQTFEKEMIPPDYQEKVWLDSAQAAEYTSIGKNTSLYINYQPGIINNDFIAIHFDFSAYYGGAHPVQYFQQLNFDVTNKKILELQDLFRPNSNYIDQIAEYCRKDLLSRVEEIGSDSTMVLAGLAPEIDNFKDFELTSQGLKIYFAPYQVAPYASGPQEVKIPYTALEKILQPDGVWKKIRK